MTSINKKTSNVQNPIDTDSNPTQWITWSNQIQAHIGGSFNAHVAQEFATGTRYFNPSEKNMTKQRAITDQAASWMLTQLTPTLTNFVFKELKDEDCKQDGLYDITKLIKLIQKVATGFEQHDSTSAYDSLNTTKQGSESLSEHVDRMSNAHNSYIQNGGTITQDQMMPIFFGSINPSVSSFPSKDGFANNLIAIKKSYNEENTNDKKKFTFYYVFKLINQYQQNARSMNKLLNNNNNINDTEKPINDLEGSIPMPALHTFNAKHQTFIQCQVCKALGNDNAARSHSADDCRQLVKMVQMYKRNRDSDNNNTSSTEGKRKQFKGNSSKNSDSLYTYAEDEQEPFQTY